MPAPRRPRPGSDRSILWRWRRGLFLVGLVVVASTGGVAAVVFNIDLPPEEALLQTSFVCAADVTEACGPDNAIATLQRRGGPHQRHASTRCPTCCSRRCSPPRTATSSSTAASIPSASAGPLYNDLRGSGVQQGGSTITQQYVKNVYLTSERSIVRKIKEAVLAVKLERELEKEEILERYLNTIYFGRGAYGVGAATRAYFGKDVRDIGLLGGGLPRRA